MSVPTRIVRRSTLVGPYSPDCVEGKFCELRKNSSPLARLVALYIRVEALRRRYIARNGITTRLFNGRIRRLDPCNPPFQREDQPGTYYDQRGFARSERGRPSAQSRRTRVGGCLRIRLYPDPDDRAALA